MQVHSQKRSEPVVCQTRLASAAHRLNHGRIIACVFASSLIFVFLGIVKPGFTATKIQTDQSGQPDIGQTLVSAPSTRQIVRLKELPFHKVIRMSDNVAPGAFVVSQSGESGLLATTFNVTLKDNVPVHYEMLSSHVIRVAKNEVTLAGIRTRACRALPSRSGVYERTRELDMVATGYSPMEGSGSGRCATGMAAGYGVVAVDPRVIPLGSRLFIRGYGYAVAGDTGGAIKRNRIDLGNSSYREALEIGRRHVTVYVLDAPH